MIDRRFCFWYKYRMKINIKKIQQLMDDQNMTVSDLAWKMKVKETWIYAILAGRHGKTFKTLERLAKTLKVPEKDLVE